MEGMKTNNDQKLADLERRLNIVELKLERLEKAKNYVDWLSHGEGTPKKPKN